MQSREEEKKAEAEAAVPGENDDEAFNTPPELPESQHSEERKSATRPEAEEEEADPSAQSAPNWLLSSRSQKTISKSFRSRLTLLQWRSSRLSDITCADQMPQLTCMKSWSRPRTRSKRALWCPVEALARRRMTMRTRKPHTSKSSWSCSFRT